MEKIDFKDYPDTTTPINAENLNTMQDNAEASIIEVDTKNTNLKNQVANGWYEIDPTAILTFSSWDASVYTGVVSTNSDLTSALSLGMKIKLTQNGVVKYGFITAITSSAITLFMGTDYILEDIAISDMCYSMLKAPYGFPIESNSWSVTHITSSGTQNNPNTASYYNLGSAALVLPIGDWNFSYNITFRINNGATSTDRILKAYISNSSSSLSSSNAIVSGGFVGNYYYDSNASGVLNYNVTSKTTKYLIFRATNIAASGASIELNSGGILKATCAYL